MWGVTLQFPQHPGLLQGAGQEDLQVCWVLLQSQPGPVAVSCSPPQKGLCLCQHLPVLDNIGALGPLECPTCPAEGGCPTGLSAGIGTVVVSCKACPTPDSLALSHPFHSSRVTFPASFKGQYFLPAGPLSTGVLQGPRPHPGQPLISSELGWQKRRLRPLLPSFVAPPNIHAPRQLSHTCRIRQLGLEGRNPSTQCTPYPRELVRADVTPEVQWSKATPAWGCGGDIRDQGPSKIKDSRALRLARSILRWTMGGKGGGQGRSASAQNCSAGRGFPGWGDLCYPGPLQPAGDRLPPSAVPDPPIHMRIGLPAS